MVMVIIAGHIDLSVRFGRSFCRSHGGDLDATL